MKTALDLRDEFLAAAAAYWAAFTAEHPDSPACSNFVRLGPDTLLGCTLREVAAPEENSPNVVAFRP